MRFLEPLIRAKFKARRKRFFADCELEDGTKVVAHCANTGSMATCLALDAPVLLSYHDDPKRKLAYSLQALQMPDGWVGLNTALANKLVAELIDRALEPSLSGYQCVRREVPYGENSRADFFLCEGRDREGQPMPDCMLEVKNATLLLAPGRAAFPDTITTRGSKHLRELRAWAEQGKRAILFYCVQRESAKSVEIAAALDPEYAREYHLARRAGLEVLAYRARFEQNGITLADRLEMTPG